MAGVQDARAGAGREVGRSRRRRPALACDAMPALKPPAYRKGLQQRAFAPAYLFHGDDDFLKDAAVRQLVAAAVDPATRDFNCETRRAGDVDAETLGSLLGTPPMMAERRLLVVHDVAALKKDARKALDRYLARPAGDVVVALVALAGGKADKALLDHPAVTSVEFPQLAGDVLAKWAAQYLDAELGGSITPA